MKGERIMKKKNNEKSFSSVNLREEMDRELERRGKKPLPEAKSCSGNSGSWKNLKDRK